MAFLGPILPALGGLLGISAAKSLLGGAKKLPQQMVTATRDDAEAQLQRDDELRRRKGAAADILTGLSGAEPTGAMGRFVLGS
jgi:hypothetical protein